MKQINKIPYKKSQIKAANCEECLVASTNKMENLKGHIDKNPRDIQAQIAYYKCNRICSLLRKTAGFHRARDRVCKFVTLRETYGDMTPEQYESYLN